MGDNSRESFIIAVADHPPSVLLLRRSRRLERVGLILGVSGIAVGLGIGLSAFGVQREAMNTVFEVGLGVMLSSFLTSATIGVVGDKAWGAAVAGYNDWARQHQCPSP